MPLSIKILRWHAKAKKIKHMPNFHMKTTNEAKKRIQGSVFPHYWQ